MARQESRVSTALLPFTTRRRWTGAGAGSVADAANEIKSDPAMVLSERHVPDIAIAM
jgi:hypothetical protein